MTLAYLNGRFQPLEQVSISPLDRGFLFADGVYEVIPVFNGRLFRLTEHLQRLHNSLDAIRLPVSLGLEDWARLLEDLANRNGGGDLSLYLQVTRGASPIRDHPFPAASIHPTVFAMVSPLKPYPAAVYRDGLAAITLEDIRWGACQIKSIALLANVLARQQAMDRGAADAILVRDGYLTEGTASNVFLVMAGVLLTPRRDQRILPGITRDLVLELAQRHGCPCREEDLPATALESAEEVWFTSSTKEIVPVTTVNGRRIGTGAPGPLWRRMMDLYQAYKRAVCPTPALERRAS